MSDNPIDPFVKLGRLFSGIDRTDPYSPFYTGPKVDLDTDICPWCQVKATLDGDILTCPKCNAKKRVVV